MELYKSKEGRAAMVAWYDSLAEKFAVPCDSVTVSTRFGDTHMFAAGPVNAPALLLVQGLAGSAPLWRHQLAGLSEEFRVYALDIVGQPGRSAPNPPSFLDNGYSQWLLDVLDGLGLEQAHLAGISAGGGIVMRFGMFAPHRVNKAVMIGPTGLVRARLPVKIWFNNVLRKNKDADALEDSLTSRSYSPPSVTGQFDQQVARAMALSTRHFRVDRSLRVYDEESGRVKPLTAIKVLRVFFWPEPKSALRRFQVPGLVLVGEFETLYDPIKAARKVEDTLPTVELRILEGLGHTAVYDRPDVVNPIIAEFLGRD